MHVPIVRDRGTGQSRGFGFVVNILQQLNCPFVPFMHWMHVFPSGQVRTVLTGALYRNAYITNNFQQQCSIHNAADIGPCHNKSATWISALSYIPLDTCMVCSWHRHRINKMHPCNCTLCNPGAVKTCEGHNAVVDLHFDAGNGQRRVCPADH